MNPERSDVAAALLALATAVNQGLTADRPDSVDIYAAGLGQQQIRALFFGMRSPVIDYAHGAASDGSEPDVQILGTILGRAYRVLLVGRDHAGTLGTLQIVVMERTRERRLVGAS